MSEHVEVKKSKQKRWYIALIIFLLLLNALLFYNQQRVKNENQRLVEMKEDITQEKNELQLEYDQTIRELEDLQLEKLELDSNMTYLQTKLEDQKLEIDRLFNKSNITKKELNEARNKLAQLRSDAQSYIVQIDQLRREKDILTAENSGLKQDIEIKDQQQAMLLEEKMQVENEKTSLSEANDALNTKVDKASTLSMTGLVGTGVRYKSNGKEVELSKAKKSEKIKICFDVLPNELAETGNQRFYLSVTNPEGSPMYIESLGSGTFESKDSGEMVSYTTKADISYSGKQQSYCLYWKQNFAFAEGQYGYMFYHNGYQVGKGSFALD